MNNRIITVEIKKKNEKYFNEDKESKILIYYYRNEESK